MDTADSRQAGSRLLAGRARLVASAIVRHSPPVCNVNERGDVGKYVPFRSAARRALPFFLAVDAGCDRRFQGTTAAVKRA
jgi:hypothetical protein